MNRIITVNAGGRVFQAYRSTLLRFPETPFAKFFAPDPPTPTVPVPNPNPDGPPVLTDAVFLDVNPDVFDLVLSFLRTNRMCLPTHNDALRSDLVVHLDRWGLIPHAFPPVKEEAEEEGEGEGEEQDRVILPDACVVQLCDHLQHDQGVKRHALTITYGADGFQLRGLTQAIRRDLTRQLSSTFWQCYQTNERAAFFTTTKIANGAADLLMTSITQQVIQHTERMGYHLTSSYITLSPDVIHTSVRMLIHNLIFRRTRLPYLEPSDGIALFEDGDEEEVLETFQNFEPRHVGPKKVEWEESSPAASERVSNIWESKTLPEKNY
ncbi:unnamed protein product [Phytomonas sp. Hart1]|nr:unnamed protein product [Phytomonas sp. Hart1]|eukprot:CCW71853.1 unnamed protein product [Phytomonas sp. isolate Hart1]